MLVHPPLPGGVVGPGPVEGPARVEAAVADRVRRVVDGEVGVGELLLELALRLVADRQVASDLEVLAGAANDSGPNASGVSWSGIQTVTHRSVANGQ